MKAKIVEINRRPRKGTLQLVNAETDEPLYHLDAWVHWKAARALAIESLLKYAEAAKITVVET